jgi:hypothetical protein
MLCFIGLSFTIAGLCSLKYCLTLPLFNIPLQSFHVISISSLLDKLSKKVSKSLEFIALSLIFHKLSVFDGKPLGCIGLFVVIVFFLLHMSRGLSSYIDGSTLLSLSLPNKSLATFFAFTLLIDLESMS